jgi:acyl transferase domain-containing protein/acyl carrier protein
MKRDIAIIGLSGLFQQSEDINAFWKHLTNGDELIEFFSDEELIESGFSQEQIKNPSFIKQKTTIDGASEFDPSFFGFTSEEAYFMDPQMRVMFEQVWLALEDAGCDPATYRGKIGLYTCASDNLYWRINAIVNGSESIDPFFLSQISNSNFLSTLISYKLNLRGPSFTINSACSTSLVALHTACRNLLMKECSTAVVGASSILSDPAKGYHHQEGMILSKDGHCRAFDENSTGTISGEGTGVVVLKRLEDAIAEGDQIYAVIKASAVNNDGNRKVGYTAPSVVGQKDCIQLAHRIAGVDPQSISYLEAHGTGTRLGDPVEIEALNGAFGNTTTKHCIIGSVKSNMGHLDVAAGITGLMKVALSLKHKQLVPSINFERENPEINFENGPFYVNTTTKKWESIHGEPLRAGVSSFGIGGTNAHVVLEETPALQIATGTGKRTSYVIPFSAKTTNSVQNYRRKLKDFLEFNPDVHLPSLAYTFQTGKARFEERDYISGDSADELVAQLDKKINDNAKSISSLKSPKIVFMLPGQGSQYAKMGAELYAKETQFSEFIDKGLSHLKSVTGNDFSEILFEEEDRIHETNYTQPLLFVFEYALAKTIMQWGPKPDALIGHSLGELTAAALAEVFTFEQGIDLMVARAKLMSTVNGSMLTIGCSVETIEAYLSDKIFLASVNSKQSVVVAGTEENINELKTKLKQADIACLPVKMSTAAHTPMVEQILGEYREVIASMDLKAPKRTIISNVDGKEVSGQEIVTADYWCKQLASTVRISDGLETLLNGSNGIFVEIGPGNMLSTFVRQNVAYNKEKHATVQTIPSANQPSDAARFFTSAIGQLWTKGGEIDWKLYNEGNAPRKISTPGYAFEKKQYPVVVDPISSFAGLDTQALTAKREVSEWLYVPGWRQSYLSEYNPKSAAGEIVLMFVRGTEPEESLLALFKAQGYNVITVSAGTEFNQLSDRQIELNPAFQGSFEKLYESLSGSGISIDHLVYCWDWDKTELNQKQTFMRFLNLFKGLKLHEADRPLKLTYVTDCCESLFGEKSIDPEKSLVLGLLKVASQENPQLTTLHIDVKENEYSGSQLLNEITRNSSLSKVAYRANRRWVESFETLESKDGSAQNVISVGGVYLITGGSGQAGCVLAEHLAKDYNATVLLLGRKELGNDDTFSADMQATLRNLNGYKGRVSYHSADISNKEKLHKTLSELEMIFGAINGVIHAAGVTSWEYFKPIEQLDQQNVEIHMAAKVLGTVNLHDYFATKSLDFLWMTSSLSVVLGGLTFAPYVGVNKFMDSYIQGKPELSAWTSVNLDGLAFSESSAGCITPEDLITIFESTVHLKHINRVVCSGADLEKTLRAQSTIKPDLAAENREFLERPKLDPEYLAPETETETIVMNSWIKLFRYNQIGMNDNFFDIGGDSLKAMLLCKQILKELGVEIPLDVFFQNPTIKLLAGEIEMAKRIKVLQSDNTTTNEILI